MEPVIVKFDWDSPSIIENKGHNQSEWGIRKPIHKIITYKMKWE